ncbi:MAG TPA: hypothetical protein VFR94_06740 [Nitrososphaeraceae archaeon]|jgi:hypothetical protein|nr:hypothetical protein [Nitrososphaeraceae archaeon]
MAFSRTGSFSTDKSDQKDEILVRIINLQNATLFRINGKDKNKGHMVTMLGVN